MSKEESGGGGTVRCGRNGGGRVGKVALLLARPVKADAGLELDYWSPDRLGGALAWSITALVQM